MSWTEAGELDIVTAMDILELVYGKPKRDASVTYVSRRRKRKQKTPTHHGQ